MFFLKHIDFSGFSRSDKWEGCFEKKKPFDFLLIEDAIEAVRSFFCDYWEDFFSISALSYNDEIELHKKMPKEYKCFYDDAKKMGYLRDIDDKFESYLYGDIPLAASSLSISFCNDAFFNVSRLLMGHGGVVGQVLFFINIEIGVALYPHDDIGFGIISLAKDNEICKDFLNFIENDYRYKDKFRVIR